VHNNQFQSGAFIYPGSKKIKQRVIFPEKHETERKTIFKDQFVVLLQLVKPQPLINIACNLLVGN